MAKDDMVRVSTAELAELLGLPLDTPADELRRKFYEGAAALAAQEEAKAVAAAEAAACAEDRRLVIAAVNDGRLPANKVEFWCAAIPKNREGNRAVIASLAKGLRPDQQLAADDSLEAVHDKVLRRAGVPTQLRSVAASGNEPQIRGGGTAPPPAPPPRLDAVGLPLPDVPRPVVIKKGTPVEELTERQRQDLMLRRMNPMFHVGTEKVQFGDTVYWPSPNDVVEFNEATGTWVEKRPYREI